ncbi:hypothetical protein [Candidatus Enterovibrio altilux]|nr:hypothetical protein [Candidatus Enterovibrio luxaltus]
MQTLRSHEIMIFIGHLSERVYLGTCQIIVDIDELFGVKYTVEGMK